MSHFMQYEPNSLLILPLSTECVRMLNIKYDSVFSIVSMELKID